MPEDEHANTAHSNCASSSASDCSAGEEYARTGDALELPIGEDGLVDWDAYYADPRLVARMNDDIAARREGRPLPIIGRTSANGSVMAAVALGFQHVFQPDKAKQEIVQERDDSGDPDNPNKALHLDFDPDDPKNTRAIVRRPAK